VTQRTKASSTRSRIANNVVDLNGTEVRLGSFEAIPFLNNLVLLKLEQP
jgi:hypothetical protein